MGKTVILSQKQLDEICGGDAAYLDDLALKPDMGNVYANEISVDGSLDNGYPQPTTTDDFSHTMTNDWRGNSKLAGMGPITVHEMTKKEWDNRYLAEDDEHGNARLKNRKFGAMNGEQGKSYQAAKQALWRQREAVKDLKTGTPEEKDKAAKTIVKQQQNWPGINLAARQYDAAKKTDKMIQQDTLGPKIKSTPKQSGNGKAHSPKDGIITYM